VTHISKVTLAAALAMAVVSHSAQAALIKSGSGGNNFNLGNAQTSWGTIDHTQSSVIVELNFDFTADADAITDNIGLWEFGAGTGSSLSISGDDLFLGSGSHSTVGAHGLSSPTSAVQVVSLIDVDNDVLSIYVNGNLVASNNSFTSSDWAGTDASRIAPSSNLGGPDPGNPFAPYPDAGNANFSINVYTVNDSADGAGTALSDVLVSVADPAPITPEPTTAALGVLGIAGLMLRRRHG